MDVFGKGEIRPLDPPGVCFICEETPHQDAELVVNTNRHFHPGGPTHLTGRKYVCGPCARELGESVGLVPAHMLEVAYSDLETAKAHLAIAEQRLLVKNDLIAAVQRGLDNGLLPKPKPAVKKAAPKTED